VVGDGPLGQMQCPRDLGVGLAARDVREHLLLAPRQPGGVRQRRALRPARRPTAALGAGARELPRGGARPEPL